MKRYLNILSMVLTLFCLGFSWQSTFAQALVSSNRFLFVIETTRAMKPRMPAVVQSVQELLGSGLEGQLRAGDTIGLWTYDNELHAGIFPMMTWSERNSGPIAAAAGEYLSKQKPKGAAKMPAVLPDMLRLLRESDAITVLWYSDGTQPIRDTPFDESINEAFDQHRRELREANLPFVTVLIGRAGKVVKCSMNSSLGVSVPSLPLPGETSVPTVIKPAPIAPVAPPPVRTNAPLIVDYSRSNVSPALVGGTRLREMFSGVPMAKDSGVGKSNGANPETVAATQPKVMLEPSAPKQTTALDVLPVTTSVSRETMSVSVPLQAIPSPSAAVQTSLPPLIVVYTNSNNSPIVSETILHQPKHHTFIWWWWVGGTLLVLLISGWLWRYARTPKGGSLITRSIERKN